MFLLSLNTSFMMSSYPASNNMQHSHNKCCGNSFYFHIIPTSVLGMVIPTNLVRTDNFNQYCLLHGTNWNGSLSQIAGTSIWLRLEFDNMMTSLCPIISPNMMTGVFL